MINLKIDPEFQSQISPLTDDEFKQLEENILKEGKLISPLIVWNNTLVDGHNRYAILQKHPEIYFSTMPLPFESREEVLAWICKNQLGRRNLTPEQKKFLMGKQYSSEKRTEAFRGNQHLPHRSRLRHKMQAHPAPVRAVPTGFPGGGRNRISGRAIMLPPGRARRRRPQAVRRYPTVHLLPGSAWNRRWRKAKLPSAPL